MEKLKGLFSGLGFGEGKDDSRFKGQGRKLGSAEPAKVGGGSAGSSGQASRAGQATPGPPSLGQGKPRLHHTEEVVLDTVVMANTPTGREAQLLASRQPPPSASNPLQAPTSAGTRSSPNHTQPGLPPRGPGAAHASAAGASQLAQRRLSLAASTPTNLGSMVSTISTPTAAEKRMGVGFHARSLQAGGEACPPGADYGGEANLHADGASSYELQRCLALVLSAPSSGASASLTMSSPVRPGTEAVQGGRDGAAQAEAQAEGQAEGQEGQAAQSARHTEAEGDSGPVAPGAAAEAGLHGCGGPAEACDALLRLLRNIVGRPGESKFRQIRLSNPRVQSSIVGVPGAVEFLEAAGFNMIFMPDDGSENANQGFLVLPEDVPASALTEPLRLLTSAMAAHGMAAPQEPAVQHQQPQQPHPQAAVLPGALPGPAGAAAAPAGGVAAAASAPAVERNTQVVLPATTDVSVPEWFFERTAAEVKAQWAAMLTRRQADGALQTRAMRERAAAEAAGAEARPGAPNVATVRVRFPEGVCLQGCFGAAEPVSRIFEWVGASLRSTAITYELVKPDRKPLAVTGPPATAAATAASARRPGGGLPGSGAAAAAAAAPLTVRGADLLPAVLLNLRPTGQEAAAMAAANLPLLSDAMLATTQAQ